MYQNTAEFYADFETVDKNEKKILHKKVTGKKVSKIVVCPLLYVQTNNFFCVHFFPIISTEIKSYFWYSNEEKKEKFFGDINGYTLYEYFLELVQCQFARNIIANWKTFLTSIFKILFGILLLANPIML